MRKSVFTILALLLSAVYCHADDAELSRAKLELLVEQAGELLAEANRKGSETHTAPCIYYFGLVYGSGTNILARADGPRTSQLARQYMKMIDKDYAAYTKVETAFSKAASTGEDSVRVGRRVFKNGTRHRAKRIANAEKLGDAELAKAIKQWESFAVQLKKTQK